MIKKVLVGTAVLLLVGLSASAIAASNRASISEKVVLTFEMQNRQGDNIDLGQQGIGLGDEFISNNLLLQDDDKAGRMDVVCTVTGTAPLRVLCNAAIRLGTGEIALSGLLPGRALQGQKAGVTIAVVGGTGAYRHVHGVATVNIPDSTVTLTLTP